MRKESKLSPRSTLNVRMGALAAAAIFAAGAQTPFAQTASAPTIPAPKLAPNVKPQPAYEAPPPALYVGAPTSIHTDITPYSPRLAELDRIGEKLTPIAKVKDWDWYVVARDGVGIGYVAGPMLSQRPIPKT